MFVAWVILCSLSFCVCAAEEVAQTLDFSRLKAAHPRILVDETREATIRALLVEDMLLQKIRSDVEAEAKKLLNDTSLTEYIIIGPRLLQQSRKCLHRIMTLGTMYRLAESDDEKALYKERIMREVRSVASFPDWNPSHFLDTAEMTAAVAIAFDWMYDSLSDEEKALFVNTIYEKGLKPSLGIYQKKRWWVSSGFNWNQVCNGGMVLGALAIMDELDESRRAEAEFIVRCAIQSVPRAMRAFDPDGAWEEGPAYWEYTTKYTIFLVQTLEIALGSDFGISKTPGFALCGNSQMAIASTTGRSFNFADSGESATVCPQLFWLADRFQKPEWAQYVKECRPRGNAYYFWYYTPLSVEMESVAKDFYFRKAELVTMRGAWTNPDAWFVGFKAGDNAINHSHLELGSFVLDRNGVRWVVDLGADNYNLPQYFGKLRWTYYRLSTRGQNTILINDENQPPKAVVQFVQFETSPEKCVATADLASAYPQLQSAKRTITLDRENSCVVVHDVLGPANCEGEMKEIVWQIHTRAEIKIAADGKSAILVQKEKSGEKKLVVTLEEGSEPDAKFEVRQTTQGEAENPNKGVLRLVVALATHPSEEQVLVVKFADEVE